VETSEVLVKPAPLFSTDGVSPSEANGSLEGFWVKLGDVVSRLRPRLSVFSMTLYAMAAIWARNQMGRGGTGCGRVKYIVEDALVYRKGVVV